MKITDSLEQRYRDYLETLSLMSLRVLGRSSGVSKASSLNKDLLVEALIDIYTNRSLPAPRTNRGAPAKENFIDPAILDQLDRIRRSAEEQEDLYFTVSSGEQEPSIFDSPVYKGILEITTNGYGFLRAKNCQPSATGEDVFVSAPMIHSLKLREGDFVACTVQPAQKNGSPALDVVLSVNGFPSGKYERRPHFDALTAQYAQEKIALSKNDNSLSLRMLDLFAPVGKGQRALVIAPPKAGKTTLLKDVARAISQNHSEISLLVLLIDERPEEVTDFRMSVSGAEIMYSTFDEGAEHHIRVAELAIEHAKRIAELGQDVVVLLDSLTKLTRAYNAVSEGKGKTLTGGLDVGAFAEPKKFFGAARNTMEAGSLTILATALVETGSRMDDVIYEEFKGTGNADIFLSRDLAERRIFPAIDIRRSGTRKEELLLGKEELACVYKMREKRLTENVAGVIDMLGRTADNADFIARLPKWLASYKSE